jgi:DNA-binding XRE family transcriptional regulator
MTHPGGRPSKYKEAFCNEVIELMASGLSLTAAAASLGVSRETIYAWEREIPEFSDAVKVARAKRTLKLEKDLLGAESGPVVTSRIFALKNACAEEWREKQEVEQKLSVSGSITYARDYIRPPGSDTGEV